MANLLKDIFEVRPLSLKTQVEPSRLLLEDFQHDVLMESVRKTSGLNQVLGIISGPYFVPDGRSRNRRFYPARLWERVVEEVAEDLKRTGRLGTLEHPLNESDAHPKNASHVLKKLWIKDGVGYGKSYLLNTPMGSLVHVLSTASDEEGKPLIQLYVSSRAYGELSGKDSEGYDIVDPDRYLFQTFDLVLEPGFLQARPELVSVVESVVQELLSEGTDSRRSYSFAGNPMNEARPSVQEAPVSEAVEDEEGLDSSVKELARSFLQSSPAPSLPRETSRVVESSELERLREENRILKEELQKAARILESYRLRDLSESYGVSVEELRRLQNKLGSWEAMEAFLEELSKYRKSFSRSELRRREVLRETPRLLESEERLPAVEPEREVDLERRLLEKFLK